MLAFDHAREKIDAPLSVQGATRRTDTIIRLVGAVLLEANDEWLLQHRYMQTEAMTELTPPLIEAEPTQISTKAA